MGCFVRHEMYEMEVMLILRFMASMYNECRSELLRVSYDRQQ